MFESTMIRAQKSLIEQLQKEIRKLEEEVNIKEHNNLILLENATEMRNRIRDL